MPKHVPKLQTSKATEEQTQRIFQQRAEDLGELVQDIGLPQDNPHFQEALKVWQTNLAEGKTEEGYRAAKAELKKGQAELKTKETEALKELVNKRVQEELEKTGVLHSDVATPTGVPSTNGIPTKLDDFRKWVADLSPEDSLKREKEIDNLLASGRIR